ncbi:Nuclear hormone receptor [Dirofilaria immitis]
MMEAVHDVSSFCVQTVLAFMISTVLLWWGCCNRSVKHDKKFRHRSATSDETRVFTGTANSVTRTSKTYHDDVRSPGLSKSRSVPRTSSEKSLEATQAETMKLIHQSHSKSKSLKLKNLDPLQHEEDIVQRKEEQDSFATHIPKKRVARRSTEIKSRPPVRCDRDDYKTIPAHMLPSSTDDL